MELIEYLEGGLGFIAALVKLLLEALGIFTIFIGVIRNGRRAMLLLSHPSIHTYTNIRARFARSLALALEFQLGADIIGTAIAPSNEALIQLGAIAIIRTFLNYFLAKELTELKKEERDVVVKGDSET